MMASMTPRTWRCGAFEFALASPLVMGIVNVTPDSFSDGGEHSDADAAVAHGGRLLAEGAHILDVGGESTRPGAEPVALAAELARIGPVVTRLAAAGTCVSIDTRHAEVARAALDAGASIVNDVTGFTDLAMVGLAAARDCGVVVMHMLGEPQTMQSDPRYDDVVTEVRDFLLARARVLEAVGVARDRIAIDPGIGFGKTLEQNLALLRAIPELAATGYPVLVGASRKRFIGELTGVTEPCDRVAGSVAAALIAVERGALVVRVHDVAATAQAFAVAAAVDGRKDRGA